MEDIVARLEGLVARIAGGGGGDGETAVSVSEFDALYTSSVQPFVDACSKFDETKGLGNWAETAFKHCRVVLEAASQCKKPSDADVMKFLGPIVSVITEAQNSDNRAAFFPQQKSFGEAIQCLNFLLAPGPPNTVAGQRDAADFYFNKCLTMARDKEDPDKTNMRAYVSTMKDLLNNLEQYCKDFHKTGVMWKVSGIELKDFKAGAKPAASSGAGASVEGRLENLCGSLEAYAAKMSGGGEDGPVCVGAYQEFYDASVAPFLETCKAIDAQIAGWTEKAFKHMGVVIKATTECKKPSPEAFMKFLGPIVEVITAAGGPPPAKSTVVNNLKAFNEAIQALNFVCMEGSPKAYIMGQIDAGSFWNNKVLVAVKEADDATKKTHRAFVSQMKDMLTALAEYANEYFKMGIMWNNKDGGDLAAAAPAPAAAKAEPVKEAPKKKAFSLPAKAASSAGGTIDTKMVNKIFVERFDGKTQKEPIIVQIPEGNMKTGVFIGNCKGPNLAIIVKGKVKNLTISGCSDIGVVFDDCITTVEIISCKKLQCQALSSAGSYIVDKSDRTTIYAAEKSLDTKVVMLSCMSTSTNVVTPTEDKEDQVENAVPDQIQSTFSDKAEPKHIVVIPEAE